MFYSLAILFIFKKPSYVLLFILGIILLGCEGVEGPVGPKGEDGLDGGYDKQIRFQVFGAAGISDTAGFIYEGDLVKFKKSNYQNVDSIVFFIKGAQSSNNNNKIFFKLYDLSNNKSIINSELSTNSIQRIDLESVNIFSNIPDEEISLGLQMSSELQGIGGQIEGSWIFLYRN